MAIYLREHQINVNKRIIIPKFQLQKGMIVSGKYRSQEGKSSHTWIQVVNLKEYQTRVGICFAEHNLKNELETFSHNIEISLFDSGGCFMTKEIEGNDLGEYNNEKVRKFLVLMQTEIGKATESNKKKCS